MTTEHFTFQGHGGKPLHGILWCPEGETRQILQLTHGMTEHIGCYESLAAYLCPNGIAVAGFDLRGHGKNTEDHSIATFGEKGWEASIEDMRCFFELLGERFPGVPRYIYGFSIGSFLLREYLDRYPADLDGALIAGTGQQPGWLLRIMAAIVNSQVRKVGFDGHTPLIRKLAFGVYNQKFNPVRTDMDWLCADEAQLDDYLADPLTCNNCSAGLFYQLLSAMMRQSSRDACKNWNQNMPVLLLYGEQDPVGDFGKGVQAFHNQMCKAGIRNITSQKFPNARHQILREESCGAAEQAKHAILTWLLHNKGS